MCLHVCLSASIYLEPLDRSSRNFVCRSPVAVARSSSGGVAIRYVLPVLWMTSRLAVMGGTTERVGSVGDQLRARPGRSLMSMNALFCALLWLLFDFYPNVTTLRSGLCCRNSVCLSSVTLVHPTQGVEPFGNISSPLCTLAIL